MLASVEVRAGLFRIAYYLYEFYIYFMCGNRLSRYLTNALVVFYAMDCYS